MAEQQTPSAAEVQEALAGVDYPASKQELREHAREHGADERVMNFLEQIPERDYTQPTEISKELSGFSDKQ